MVVGDIAVGTEVVVIGGGPGGYVAAIRAAQLGKDVLLIDKDEKGLGGICLNHGCIPSKALIYASSMYEQKKHLENMGLIFGSGNVDAAKLQAWKNANVSKLRNGIEMLLKRHGVEILYGNAQFDSSKKLKIVTKDATKYIEFDRAIIATGSRPTVLPGFEPDGKIIIGSTEALMLAEIPKSMVLIGGGYIAVELGMMYAKFGTKVSMLEKFSLLSHSDRDIVAPVSARMRELGMDIYENASPTKLVKTANGATITVSSKEKGEFDITAEKILVAIGRTPNTNDLGLEKTQVQLEGQGFVKVDAKRRSTDPHIYAVGDISGQPILAHKAFLEGKVAAEAIAGMNSAYEPQAMPLVVFSDPEIASVGISETEAQKTGMKVNATKFPLTALGKAVSIDKSNGFVKLVSDSNNYILGVHIVASNAGDLISEASLGIEMGFTLEDLAMTVHPHPSLPEALMEAAEAALGKSIHLWQPKKA